MAEPRTQRSRAIDLRFEGCVDATLLFQQIEPATIAVRLPDGFTPFINASTSKAVAWVMAVSCEVARINTGSAKSADFTLVVTRINPPEGADSKPTAQHFYILHSVTNSGELHGRFTSAGIPSEVVNRIDLVRLAPNRATLAVSGGSSPFTASVTAAATSGAAHTHAQYFWHLSDRGRAVLFFNLHSITEYAGTGTFVSASGTLLNELLGSETVSRGITGTDAIDATLTISR